MVAPWKGELAELRCTDVGARSLDEFKAFVAKHAGLEKYGVTEERPRRS